MKRIEMDDVYYDCDKSQKDLNAIFNQTEVTSVKLVLFKSVMSFETLTKVDQLTEIVRFG